LTQTAGLTAGRLVAAVISLVWTAVLARELSEEAVGALSLALTLSVALSILPDLGLPMIVADRVSRHPAETRALVRHVVVVRFAASILTAGVLVGMFRLGSSATLALPLLLAVSVAATTVHTTATAALRGLGLVLPDACNEVGSRLLVLGLGTVLLTHGGGAVSAAAVLAVADICSAIVLAVLVRRCTTTGTRHPAHVVAWGRTLPLAGALVVASLHTRIDVWLLAVLSDGADVAHYALPARIAEGLLLPAAVAAVLVLPLTGRQTVARIRGRQALRYVGLVAVLVATGATITAVFAEPVLRTAFGTTYAADAPVLRLLCLAAVPSAVAIGLAPVIALLARRLFLRTMVAALALNVLANLLLVPDHGATGAAIASVLSTTLLAVGLVIATSRLPGAGPTDGPSGTPNTTSASLG